MRPPSRLSKFPILLIPLKKEGLRSGNSIYYGNPINSSGAHVLDNLLAVAQQPAAFATTKDKILFYKLFHGKKRETKFQFLHSRNS